MNGVSQRAGSNSWACDRTTYDDELTRLDFDERNLLFENKNRRFAEILWIKSSETRN